MNNIVLEEKYILEYIRDMLLSFKIRPQEVNNVKYHHNTKYSAAPSILKNGILSLKEQNRLGLRKDSEEFLKLMDDIESHINGISSISLSVVGLDDIYRDELEYQSDSPLTVDFGISSDVKTIRLTLHYANEFLCDSSISVDKIKAVDIRLFNFMKLIKKDDRYYNIHKLIDKYNNLKDIAMVIKSSNLDMPLREMSQDNLTLDVDKVSKTKKIILK